MDNQLVQEIAEWMLGQLREKGELYQADALQAIEALFGEAYTIVNANGNLGISPNVLKAFKQLTPDSVVWEHGDRCWRWRYEHDLPGRRVG